jgi:hypothetical protein
MSAVKRYLLPRSRLSRSRRACLRSGSVRRELAVQPGETMTKVVKSEQADAVLRNQREWMNFATSWHWTTGAQGGHRYPLVLRKPGKSGIQRRVMEAAI